MSLINDLAGDLAAIFPDLATGSIQVSLAGLPVFGCAAIVKTDPGYRDIDGVGLVSSEPHVVVLAADALRIDAGHILTIDAVDWQLYGEPLPRRSGLTNLNLIRL